MSIPLSLVSFLTLHFLYKILNSLNISIKSLLKSYSLAYGIILILFVQNINRLFFLACHNMKHLFFFNTLLYIVQGVTIIFVGFLVILSISFFYMMRYLYSKKIQYLPFNLKKKSLWPTILLICYVLRPLL